MHIAIKRILDYFQSYWDTATYKTTLIVNFMNCAINVQDTENWLGEFALGILSSLSLTKQFRFVCSIFNKSSIFKAFSWMLVWPYFPNSPAWNWIVIAGNLFDSTIKLHSLTALEDIVIIYNVLWRLQHFNWLKSIRCIVQSQQLSVKITFHRSWSLFKRRHKFIADDST